MGKVEKLRTIDRDWWKAADQRKIQRDLQRENISNLKALARRRAERLQKTSVPNNEMPPERWTVQFWAKHQSLSLSTLYRDIKLGKLKAQPAGIKKLISAAEMNEYLEVLRREAEQKRRNAKSA